MNPTTILIDSFKNNDELFFKFDINSPPSTQKYSFDKTESEYVGSLIKNKKILISLYFGNVTIDLKSLFNGLDHNTHITKLYFGRPNRGWSYYEQLYELLKYNKTIKTLGFYEISFSFNGILSISKILKYNQTIKKFVMSSCIVGTTGFKYLCAGITKNKTLKTLNFIDDSLSDKCLDFIINIITNTHTIQKIDLDYNCISSIDEALHYFKYNNSIVKFNVKHLDLPPKEIILLNKKLRKNKRNLQLQNPVNRFYDLIFNKKEFERIKMILFVLNELKFNNKDIINEIIKFVLFKDKKKL